MFSILKLTLKIAIVGGIAIFLGHFIQIGGVTLNDRVGIIAEQSKKATITKDIQRWAHQIKQPLNAVAPKLDRIDLNSDEIDEVEATEQQRLKALLKQRSVSRSR